MIALVTLVAVMGFAMRFISDDERSDPRIPPGTSQASLQPTRTPQSDVRVPTRTAPTPNGQAEFPPGFVPASWATTLPSGVESATVATIFDGDTFDLTVNGVTSRYRLYRSDAPESHDPLECGGNEATAFVQTAIGRSDTPGELWVEDVGQLDRFGRTLAYLWFTADGQPYLLNHVLINAGWAENVGYGDSFDPYRPELASAATYAANNRLGVWAECGAFGLPIDGIGATRS